MNDLDTINKVFSIFNNNYSNALLDKTFKDGRIASIMDEASLKEIIKKKCEENDLIFEDMPPRAWCDFKINGTPFNLKEGTGKTADNFSSKKGLVYAIVGKEIKDGASHKVALDTIVLENYNNESDYGIIFFNKLTKQFKVSSLKNIDKDILVPNGSNLPFQIKLGKLDDVLNHSSENQNIELLKKYLQSIKKHNIDFSLLEDKIISEENDEIKEWIRTSFYRKRRSW